MDRDSVNYEKPTIQNLFTNRRYFIPKYQRAFSWQEDNAEKFWDDIFEFNDNEDYFLGSIVLNTKEKNTFEVIDGQQRLTTCSLFFLAIYLVYKENVSPDGASRHIYKYLSNGNIKEEFNLLTLSKNNDEFYKKLLSIKTVSNLPEVKNIKNDTTNKNLLSILRYFINKLKEGQNENIDIEKTRLDNFLYIFENNVFFLEIKVSDYGQASKLFEVLNNRGTDLTDADLLRNYLLAELESKKLYSIEIQKKWDEIEENVQLDNLEQFLRYSSFLISEEKILYERIKCYSDLKSPKFVIELLNTLSIDYAKLLNPEGSEIEKDEFRLLEELLILGNTQARSVILASYRKFSKEDILELLKFIISFTVRYSILGKNPNKLEKLYSGISFDIYQKGLNLQGVIDQLKPLINNSEEFKINFINHEYKTTKLPRYILIKIENYISTGEKDVNSSSIHLEHIMPENISKWQEVDKNYFDIHKEFVNTIGNMVILKDKLNTRIKNNIFEIKKSSYDESAIKLLEEIKTLSTWSDKEIKLNSERYLNLFNEIWTY